MKLNFGVKIDPASEERCWEVEAQATNDYVIIDETVSVSKRQD